MSASNAVSKFLLGIAIAFVIPRVPLWWNSTKEFIEQQQQQHGSDNQDRFSLTERAIAQVWGEAWIPRTPAQGITLAQPVSFNPQGT